MANFDASDKDSWFFPEDLRVDAEDRLLGKEPGLFLVRPSTTCKGDFVLSVSENNKVSHYIVEVRNGQYHIGELHFQSLPAVIEFYKVHYLDTTTLSRPCSKNALPPPPTPPQDQRMDPSPAPPLPAGPGDQQALRYRVKYNFPGEDEEDLPCKKGEELVLLEKEEDNWWKMRNEKGQTGLVPKPYIEQISQSYVSEYKPLHNEPVLATVVQSRVPTPYDYTQLKLDVGDCVRVLQQNTSGQWEGEVVGSGKKGFFPFRCVKVLNGPEREAALQRYQSLNGPVSQEDDPSKKVNGMN